MELLAEQPKERYAHSLSTIRKLGRAATAEAFGSYEIYNEMAFVDFLTAVTEMLKTDPEFRHSLDIDKRPVAYDVTDGKTRAPDGTPMIDILETGARHSKQAAKINPAYNIQAERDWCDVGVAKRADALIPGMSLVTLSMEPKDGLAEHPETYKELGYKKGLVYIQTYSKTSDNVLEAGSYSVDLSDETAWREVLEQNGFDIPEGISLASWISHGVEIEASSSEAEQFAISLREQYYQRIGSTHNRKSITRYVEENRNNLRTIFDTYYPSLGTALTNGENSDVIREIAAEILRQDISGLKTSVVEQLIKINTQESFDENAARTMDSILRYAAVEVLRKGLGKTFNQQIVVKRIAIAHQDRFAINTMVAGGVGEGVKAGRSYGGCAGNIELEQEQPGIGEISSGRLSGPQEAFGGKGEDKKDWEWKKGVCIVDNCPTRPRKTKVGPCSVCECCQNLFDKGKDPKSEYKLRRAKAAYN